MASVQASEIPQEQSFMGEYWNFRKQFYYGEESDEYWEALVAETDRLSKKYKSVYVDNILIICVNDIEIRYKKFKGKSVSELKTFDLLVEMLRKDRKIDSE